MGSKAYYPLDYDEVADESTNAIQLEVNGALVWIPKSVMMDMGEDIDTKNGGSGTIEVEEWFLKKEGLV